MFAYPRLQKRSRIAATRCLRSNLSTALLTCWAAIAGSWPVNEAVAAERFVFSGDGREVTDNRTGLIWRRCVEGMAWNGAACAGTAKFFMWHQALIAAQEQASASGKPWRLPNVKELASLADLSGVELAIDRRVFPGTPNDQFWCSTPYAADAFYAWVVHSFDGSVYYTYLEDNGAARLVRDSQ